MSTELVVIEELEKPKVFAPKGLDPILKRIDKQVRSIHLDPTTKPGRENIKSIAYKVAQSKTAILNAGKSLTERMRKEIGEINEERDRGVQFLQDLQDEVRKPVTEFENKEKDRIQAHNFALQRIAELRTFNSLTPVTSEMIEARINELGIHVDRDWEEFDGTAHLDYEAATTALNDALHDTLQREREAKELAKLRKADEERKQQEREEKIRQDAIAETEAAGKRKADKAAADLKAEKEKNDRLQRESKEREERAAQGERDRIAREKAAEEEAERKREANKKHCAKINNEALAMLISLGVEGKVAKAVIIAIAEGKVPHVSIKY